MSKLSIAMYFGLMFLYVVQRRQVTLHNPVMPELMVYSLAYILISSMRVRNEKSLYALRSIRHKDLDKRNIFGNKCS